MANYRDCKLDLSGDAKKFCPNCGTQVGVDKDIYHVLGDGLIGKVKEILTDTKVKRVVIKEDKGKFYFQFPLLGVRARAAALVVLVARTIHLFGIPTRLADVYY